MRLGASEYVEAIDSIFAIDEAEGSMFGRMRRFRMAQPYSVLIRLALFTECFWGLCQGIARPLS